MIVLAHNVQIEVETFDKFNRNFDFHVYENKVWKLTSVTGANRSAEIKLERPLDKDQMIIKANDIKNVKTIFKPSGNITI